jgi:type IV pilus assembly protein PilC
MDLEYAYDFIAKNRSREIVKGVIYATDSDAAFIKLSGMGYIPSEVPSFNLMYSIRNIMNKGFSRKDLARFYAALSKRLKGGRPIPEGLEHAMEFVDDPKLKQALVQMRQYVLEGNSIATSMKMAGFPSRDVEVIRSTAEAGRSADSMEKISKELMRAEKLRSSIVGMLRMPIIILFIMYSAFYGVLVFIAPAMMKFFKTALNNVKLPAYADMFYGFSAIFKSNLIISTIIYVAVMIGIVALVRSRAFHSMLNRIKLVKIIAERTEMANLWTSFAMMYDAGISTEQTCKLLAGAASSENGQEWFLNMHRLIRAGLRVAQAVDRAGFPDYVRRGVLAAESGTDIAGGVEEMANDLTSDVVDYTERLKDYIQIVTLAILSSFVLLFFMVSYYPIISATLSQV